MADPTDRYSILTWRLAPNGGVLCPEPANDLPLLNAPGARSGRGLVAAFAASICLWAVIGFALQRLFNN